MRSSQRLLLLKNGSEQAVEGCLKIAWGERMALRLDFVKSGAWLSLREGTRRGE